MLLGAEGHMRGRKITRACLLALGVIALSVILYVQATVPNPDASQADISELQVVTRDGELWIHWKNPAQAGLDEVRVTIASEGFWKEESVAGDSCTFTAGVHGTLYTVVATARFQDGASGEDHVAKALFLNKDQLPELPLLTIETDSGRDPTYQVVESPPEAWGLSIVDNDYVAGTLTVADPERAGITARMRIRVRGNTSAAGESAKKPYRIALNSAEDLLGREPAKPGKEWILLKCGTDLNTFIGSYVSSLCGMEWQPEMRFVNLMLNGDWKGCYLLIEPVSRETAGSYVSETGYIFEDDAYWWNENGVYFRTEGQDSAFAYTIKYPDIANPKGNLMGRLKAYMQAWDDCLLNWDEGYRDYIDEASFASWLLIKDILGDMDYAGSNMYFYKYDFDPKNPTSSKVKMGPGWDFDNVFSTPDEWSVIHFETSRRFPWLLGFKSFFQAYLDRWQDVSDTLCDDISELLRGLVREQGPAIDESWALDAARWEADVLPLSEQIDSAMRWFQTRTLWLNDQLRVGR